MHCTGGMGEIRPVRAGPCRDREPGARKVCQRDQRLELIVKFRSGKQPAFAGIAADVAAAVAAHGFGELPIALRHAQAAASLPLHHKDPMDRFIIGQALVEDMTIVTIDSIFARYGAKTTVVIDQP